MKRLQVLVVAFIVLMCFWHVKKERWPKEYGAWTSIINSDGYGYYSYLPAIILNHNFDYKEALKAVRKVRVGIPDEAIFPTVIDIGNNKQLNKCFVGIAVLLLPFFLVACLFAKLFGFDVDGFSYPFQLCVSIAALFYLFIGLFYLYKLLKLYSVSDLLASVTLITIVFATNLFYYSTMEPSMPHVYDFSLVAVFLYFTKKSIGEFQLKNLLNVALALGLLIIIRPTNVLIVLAVPFLTGSLKNTGNYIATIFKSKATILTVVLLFGVVALQFIMWHKQTGHWFVWSYPGEGFNFKTPHIIDILFSYRKGWFVYTPIMFFMLLTTFIVFLKKDFFSFISVFVFFAIITYVNSSWWYWAYGGSFGSRPFVDDYAFFALVFATSIASINSLWYKIPAVVIVGLCMKLNLIQTQQYENFILPNDNMSKVKYWKIFLKTDKEYMGCLEPKDISGDFNFLEQYTRSNDFENNTWGVNNNITMAYAHSGTHSAFSNSTLPYSPGYVDTVKNLPTVQSGKLNVYVECWVYMPDLNNDALLIISLEQNNQPAYLWHITRLPELVDSCNKWTKIQEGIELPDFKDKNDVFKTFVLTTKGLVYIDDMVVKFGTHK